MPPRAWTLAPGGTISSFPFRRTGHSPGRLSSQTKPMYAFLLTLHSVLRWVVLALLVIVVVRSLLGLRAKTGWSSAHEKSHVALVASVHLQLLIGIVLHLFLSPWSKALMANMALGMKDPTLRYFGMEHPVGMIVAAIVITVARVRSKRSPSDALRHRRVLLTTLVALLVTVGSVPWPVGKHARPLIRMGL